MLCRRSGARTWGTECVAGEAMQIVWHLSAPRVPRGSEVARWGHGEGEAQTAFVSAERRSLSWAPSGPCPLLRLQGRPWSTGRGWKRLSSATV